MAHAVLKTKLNIEAVETGIDDRQKLAGCVSASLADTYLLMVKTQGYHWNVAGPMFHALHQLTEEHYNDLFEAIDELAERIRALGYPAPNSITDMISRSVIIEETGHPTAEQMVNNLIDDHEVAAERFREFAGRAEEFSDLVTADMLTERLKFHEKAIWMLRALRTQ